MSKENEKKELVASESYSQRFTNMVVREFSKEIGKLQMTPYQERLAQHLFIGMDSALKKAESDRQKKNEDKMPIVWSNVNMEKVAIDAVHRVELGLDALIPNHIHVVPYQNNKTGKYDIDLQIGYVGKDYYKRKLAIDPPVDVIYQLVHASDKFTPKMKNFQNDTESYDFEITKPFDRGEVVGGFGYILHSDPTKNKLVIVPKSSMDKSKQKAKTSAFWSPYPEEMQMVVLVRRVTAKMNIDPEKVNASFAAVEIDENQREMAEFANQGDIIDIVPDQPPEIAAPEPDPEKKPEKKAEKHGANAPKQWATGDRGMAKDLSGGENQEAGPAF